MNWLISANDKLYDHASAFQKWGFIDWHQGNRKYEVKDVVYIYCTKPTQKVMYKTVVQAVGLTKKAIVNDSQFWHNQDLFTSVRNGRFARLYLVAQVSRNELSLPNLLEHGLCAPPQGPIKLVDELKEYIDLYMDDNFFEDTFPDSADTSTCTEGAKVAVFVNKYERSSIARDKCIQYHGCYCHVCGLDFERQYGVLGKGFIHVHHIVPLNEIGKGYAVDYKNDLIPVCPNCHAMLHRKLDGKVQDVETLKQLFVKS
ncbi:MAG: HNH endonuclease [Oscillospiraceae bacterium]